MSATDETTQAASLADAVLTAEAERQAAHEEEEILFADDLLPGVGARGDDPEAGRWRSVGRSPSPCCSCSTAVDEARDGVAGRARARHPRQLRGQRRRDRVHQRGVRRVHRARRAADGLAGRPLPSGRRSSAARRRHLLRLRLLVRPGGQRLHALPRPLRRGHRQVLEHHRPRRHWSPTPTPSGPWPAQRHQPSAAVCSSARISPVLVGGIATLAGGADGWRWAFFLLGLPALVLAFFAFRIPEPPRGQFEMIDVLGEVIDTTPDADLDRGGVRPPQADPHLPTRDARLRRHSASACSPARCSRTSTSRTTSTSTRSSAACSARSAASWPSASCRSPPGATTPCFRHDPAKALRLVGLLIIPSRSSSRSST